MSHTYEDRPTLAAWNALAEGAGVITLLYDYTVPEDAKDLKIDIASQHWEAYSFIALQYESTCTEDGYFYVNIDNKGTRRIINSDASYTNGFVGAFYNLGFQSLLFTNRGQCGMWGLSMSTDFFVSQISVLAGNCKKLNIVWASGNTLGITQGSRLRIWGIL